MKPKGGSFGMIALVIVMAVVLFLVAQAWNRLVPEAVETTKSLTPTTVHDHGQAGAGAAVRSGDLPDLDATRDATGVHSADVQQALDAIE